ncbi:B12-binding domain-containing radical SAM protein [Hymenobacter sp. BT491]|uniref:B12-binding domain-containing radical SAM protein n=1 Tax=Hymenobacter sp. BT491 TaxID=2766779 RepID=UPI0016536CE6|nr:radical SAM protein [Hymenobacter sp. BT491]MBC6991385.1 B12-binding domain-containing radical SAM protein [Hymenobacter sp. BT491]
MRVKFILPALTEATNPYWRPIKYSLFPPLGLATLAAYLPDSWEAELQDEHVEPLRLDDAPKLVVIQVYITNAYRAYALADLYRSRGSYVCLGGLHVTSLPAEAAAHADSIFLGPGEETFPQFLRDWQQRRPQPRYESSVRTLVGVPPIRRDLIRRELYLVPNSIVVTRGCPHHCDFCYKDAFFEGGKSFYTQPVDDALAEIDRLPGRHLYFLDDHLLGHQRFAASLFDGMRGMGRLFQGAATVDSILRDTSLLEKAAVAGLRSLFVGFETLSERNLRASNKRQNLGRDYAQAIERLHALGIMINGSFVFGLDDDGPDVFARTVEWAVKQGITTATFHIATPYPGTDYFKRIEAEGRLLHRRWDQYDTRTVVHQPGPHLTAEQLKTGYDWAYREFYSWANITKASLAHTSLKHQIKHFAYAGGWKRFEPLWNFMIKTRQLNSMRPLLEAILAKVQGPRGTLNPAPADFIPLPIVQ